MTKDEIQRELKGAMLNLRKLQADALVTLGIAESMLWLLSKEEGNKEESKPTEQDKPHGL